MAADDKPLVGIQINNDDPAEAAGQIRDFGIEVTCLHLPWGKVEPEAGRTDWTALDHWNAIREELGTPPTPCWFLFPLHMNARGDLPADLRNEPLDSPKLLDRWNSFVEEAAVRADWNGTEAIVTIGNELDIYVESNPGDRDSTVEFLRGATDAVLAHAPKARPANTLTWDSVQSPEGRALFDDLNTNTHVGGFTWYDLKDVGVTRPPTSIDATLSAMREMAGDKPVYLQEIAMPTAPACDGDEDLQAARIDELFDALGRRTQDDVVAAIWLTIVDWPVEFMKEWVAGQFPDFAANDRFLGFLTSMGLVRSDGTPKPAAKTWLERAASYRR